MSILLVSLRRRLCEHEVVTSPAVRRLIAGMALVLATALGAFVVIPLPGTPVPFTLQTFFVLAGAALLGGRVGTTAQAGYLVAGGLGAPLFAGSVLAGPILLGPTGGYLLGFIAAAWIIGRMLPTAEHLSWRRVVVALVIADFTLLFIGALWLGAVLHVGPLQAALLGVLPFVPGEIVKIAAAAAIVRFGGRRSRRLMAQ